MTPLGRVLREAVVDECVDSLPVVMTLPEFAAVLGVDDQRVDGLVAAGQVHVATVDDLAYVFPASCREALLEAGMLRVPLDSARSAMLVHGARVIAPALTDSALEVLRFEAVLAGMDVDEYATDLLERHATGVPAVATAVPAETQRLRRGRRRRR